MKKGIAFGLLLFALAIQSSAQKPIQKPTRFEFYQNDSIQNLLTAVVRTDSSNKACYLTFKSFDAKDSLVTELSYYQCQNNTRAEYLTRLVYNRQGKLILRETFNMEGAKLNNEIFNYQGTDL